jgi:hypothetical protein
VIRRVFHANQLAVHVAVYKRQIQQGGKLTSICRGMFHFQVDSAGGEITLWQVEAEADDKEAQFNFEDAENRKDILLARTEFLSFHASTAPPWTRSLVGEAGRMTIEVLVRMVRTESVLWQQVNTGIEGIAASIWENAWGQPITVTRFDVSLSDVSASTCFSVLFDASQRVKWDGMCMEYSDIDIVSDTADLMRLVIRFPLDIGAGVRGFLGNTLCCFRTKIRTFRTHGHQVPNDPSFLVFRTLRTMVLGTKSKVPSTSCQVPGTRCLIPDTWYLVRGTWYLLRCT